MGRYITKKILAFINYLIASAFLIQLIILMNSFLKRSQKDFTVFSQLSSDVLILFLWSAIVVFFIVEGIYIHAKKD